MRLEERSYSGKVFRPRPEIYCDSEANLCIIATPWGPRNVAKKAIQTIADLLQSSQHDREVTSPFQIMSCLSPMANNLRAAIMLANDTIYRETNQNEYVGGVELFIALSHGTECVWSQIGGPQVILDSAHFEQEILGTHNDLSRQYSTNEKCLSPLPENLLGLASTTNFMVHSLHLSPGDRLLLLQRSLVPSRLLSLPRPERNLKSFSLLLARHSSEIPYWIGQLSFEN